MVELLEDALYRLLNEDAVFDARVRPGEKMDDAAMKALNREIDAAAP